MVPQVGERSAGALLRHLPLDQLFAGAGDPEKMQVRPVPLAAHDVGLRLRDRRRAAAIFDGIRRVLSELMLDLQVRLPGIEPSSMSSTSA